MKFGVEFWLGVWVGFRMAYSVPEDLAEKVEREILEIMEIELRDAIGLNGMIKVRVQKDECSPHAP